jgi:hypothetical protein
MVAQRHNDKQEGLYGEIQRWKTGQVIGSGR